MNRVNYREVSEEEAGQRLDNYLTRVLKGVPKSRIYRMIRSGEVRVNQKRASVSDRIQSHDSIRIPPVRMSEEKKHFLGDKLKERLTASILYEDKEILVINKPAGVAVHGGSGVSLGVIEAYREMKTHGESLELVHRLDRDTSGCLVIAKKRSVLRALHEAFSKREVLKVYIALVEKKWTGSFSQTVEHPLKKGIEKSGERHVIVHPEGKPSKTIFSLIENFENAAWVEARPETGRTHQIRVHSTVIGHPIIGDEKYGADEIFLKSLKGTRKLYLHAKRIQFALNGKLHSYEAPYDVDFEKAIDYFRKNTLGQE